MSADERQDERTTETKFKIDWGKLLEKVCANRRFKSQISIETIVSNNYSRYSVVFRLIPIGTELIVHWIWKLVHWAEFFAVCLATVLELANIDKIEWIFTLTLCG